MLIRSVAVSSGPALRRVAAGLAISLFVGTPAFAEQNASTQIATTGNVVGLARQQNSSFPAGQITALQQALQRRGLLQPSQIDGIFGPDTLKAVRKFQRSVGLPPTGLVTRETIAALERGATNPPGGAPLLSAAVPAPEAAPQNEQAHPMATIAPGAETPGTAHATEAPPAGSIATNQPSGTTPSPASSPVPPPAPAAAPGQSASAGSQGYQGTVHVAPNANGENSGAFTNTGPKATTAGATELKSEDAQGASSVNNTNANNFAAAAQLPSQRNDLLADNGDVQIRKLIGTSVYNTQDEKLGQVQDVLMGQSGQPQVVIEVEGSSKEVVVPWNKLTFGDARANADNAVLMPGITKKALSELPAYHDKESKSG